MKIVRNGSWCYSGSVDKPVDIVGLAYDFWFELAKADEILELGETPQPLGQDGLLYYVRFKHAGELTTPTWPDSAGYSTIKSAMKAAEERTPGAITWNPSSSLNLNPPAW